MKKILIFIPLLVLSLFLSSCNKDNLSDFQKVVKSVYDSEEILAGYNETNIIKDNDFEIYNKNTSFKVERGEHVKSEVEIVEKKLSTSGNSTYDETVTSYTTVDNVKYTVINGSTYENSYEMPTYYLSFVLSEEYLEEGYELIIDGDNYTLSGNVLDNKVSSLFLNKSLKNITNLSIKIIVENKLLKSFIANYKSTTGFDVLIETEYLYASVGYSRAVFYLEGGQCQNSSERVSYVYSFDGSKIDTLIVDPNVLETDSQNQIVKAGYHIEGWYRTKTVNDDNTVEYSDKWDFSKDRMTLDGVTLYAKWEINRYYSYELYYIDDSGNEVFLDSYQCNEGEKFYELFMKNREVKGYTSLGYLDENGNPWNPNFKHPGGDSDVAVKLYLNIIEGEYEVVETAKEFRSAISLNKNIYLLSDIDYDDDICFDSYTGTILGNGHTISNIEVDYNKLRSGLKGELEADGTIDKGTTGYLYIALFFELNDVTIKDLTFENIYIDVDTSLNDITNIVISPLAIKGINVNLENVSLTGTVEFSKLPDKEIEIVVNKDNFFIYQDNNSIGDDCSVLLESPDNE